MIALAMLFTVVIGHDLNPDVTQATVQQTICMRGYSASVRPPREWSTAKKHELMQRLQLPGTIRDYELDHVVPLELGGHPTHETNLQMQPWPDAKRKDDEENRLHRAVCTGRMSLENAQELMRRWK